MNVEDRRSKRINERNSILVGFELDLSIVPLMEKKIRELKTTKRKYVSDLILKDLGYTIIPAQVIPPKIVKIEKDEESV